jgi:hypothetical protein
MMGLLRIFKYVRKRIIKLSLENQRLKLQIKLLIEASNNREALMVRRKKGDNLGTFLLVRKNTTFYSIEWIRPRVVTQATQTASEDFLNYATSSRWLAQGYVFAKDKKHVMDFC